MTRIMTVDDSSTMRSIITRQLVGLGFEADQAEDGPTALDKLSKASVDLILLDVTMPGMDGPTLLQKLRERGDKTPVIMVTSEAKGTTLAGAMKLGISDFILKPFKPEELQMKISKALSKSGISAPSSGTGAATAPSADGGSPKTTIPPAEPGAKKAVDVLLVDDMENVHTKLRAILPAAINLSKALNAREALSIAQESAIKLIVVDTVIPEVNTATLLGQLRALQPGAGFIALMLKTTPDPKAETRANGFDDFLLKPFDPSSLEELLGRYFTRGEPMTVENNVLQVASYEGREDRIDKYFQKLRALFRPSFEAIASACYDDAILNLTSLPVRADKMARLLVEAEKEAKNLGLTLKLVGSEEARSALKGFSDTAKMSFFTSLEQAQGA